MGKIRARANIAGASAMVLFLAACGGVGSNREVPIESYSAEEIYRKAEFELNQGSRRADEAATLFGEIERLYPYSEWAKRALIMQAFALYQAKDYESARSTAQRFVDFYPADEDAAYAQYLLALTYYDQIALVGRDQGLTFQALQSLRTLVEIYPESEYTQSAILKFDLAFNHLAAKEMEIGRYYLKRKNFTAGINRFRVVVEDFQTTTHTAEALYRLVEGYLSLGFDAEAQTAAAILGYNFQSTEWYEDAFNLLKGQGLEPDPISTGWLRTIYRQMLKGEWL